MDAEAFDAFYSASFSRVVGQVYAMCGNFSEAQDCVQEAFVRAWDHRKALETAYAPEAWVRTVAWRLAVSRWRRTRRSLLPPDRSKSPSAPAEPDIHHTALVAALRKIPEEQRRAIVLHHLCDLPIADIAQETGVAVGTVKARLSRGRAALAALLRDEPTRESRHV
ncbi:MAG: SigE family RNA polymerase sigma factor [Actinomycetota bacterium]|nr:SigE family RNA polymerase sigma factor [Actinomycetota bacterium]